MYIETTSLCCNEVACEFVSDTQEAELLLKIPECLSLCSCAAVMLSKQMCLGENVNHFALRLTFSFSLRKSSHSGILLVSIAKSMCNLRKLTYNTRDMRRRRTAATFPQCSSELMFCIPRCSREVSMRNICTKVVQSWSACQTPYQAYASPEAP